MTNGISNFGSSLASATITGSVVGAYTALAEVIKLKFGEVKAGVVDMTSHSSTNGYKETKPSGLKEIGEMELTCNFVSASALNTWKSAIDAGTTASYKLMFGTSASMVFAGFPTSMVMGEADAQSPEALVFDIKIQPQSTFTIS